jgi:phosphate butyryltransferase
MEALVTGSGKKYRVAVAWAQDTNTLTALDLAFNRALIDAILIGNRDEIIKACQSLNIDYRNFSIIEAENSSAAAIEAVRMAKYSQADIIMKGLVGTDIFLKAVMDKETGIMLPDAFISYVCAIQIATYHKLLFVTDPAVIPFPDLSMKVAMVNYAIEMANKFGIQKPKVALISATEKPSKHFPSSNDYTEMLTMVNKGLIKECIMDGPVDLFLACDKKSVAIKGVKTPVDGDADILLFPSLEACNPFYISLMLFAGGHLAGILRGTRKPVIVMSRSESEMSKYYCIALSCLMAS